MKMFKTSLLSLVLMFVCTFNTYSYKQENLEKLIKTRNCVECDLSNMPNLKKHIDAIKLQDPNDFNRIANTVIDLSGSNLSGSDLSFAHLENCNLSGANLTRTDLRYAILYQCNLENAQLTGANLQGTDLRRANLKGTNLDAAITTQPIRPDMPEQQQNIIIAFLYRLFK